MDFVTTKGIVFINKSFSKWTLPSWHFVTPQTLLNVNVVFPLNSTRNRFSRSDSRVFKNPGTRQVLKWVPGYPFCKLVYGC